MHESPYFSKQVQENAAHLAILCSSRPYEVHMFTSLCSWSWSKWNRLSTGKYWKKFRYNCIQCFFSFSDSVIATCERHHSFLEDCEELRILRNLHLIKIKRSVFRLRRNFYRIILFDILLRSCCVAFVCVWVLPPTWQQSADKLYKYNPYRIIILKKCTFRILTNEATQWYFAVSSPKGWRIVEEK